MIEFWEKRYKNESYAYGTEPNDFFKEALDTYELSGKILLPAEGEGRNAVYAAKKGLEVFAFDISQEGKKKAMKLAQRENVPVIYEVGDFFELELINEKFDVAALIYAHFPPDILSKYNFKIGSLINPGGYLILEGFSKNHMKFQQVNSNAGGPKNLDMLFSIDSIKKDFQEFEILKLEEVEVELKEGEFHKGQSSVIRFIGRKK